MVSSKTYLKIMGIFIIFIYSIVACINYIIDPYWQFNFAPSNTIIGLNSQISNYSIGHTYPELMLERQKKMIASESIDTVIIGSSRSLRGLDTCDNKNIQKVGIHSIPQKSTLKLLKTATDHNKKYVFIEIGSLLNKNEQDPVKINYSFALFSMKIFLKSVSNFYESYITQKEYPLCKIIISPSKKWEKTVIDKYIKNYQNSFSLIEPIEKISQQCNIAKRSKNDPLNIIIYIDPMHPILIDYNTVEDARKKLERIILSYDFGEKCSVKSYAFQEHEEINQRKNWYDINHYNPTIGNQFLDEMIKESTASKSQ